MKKMKSTKKTFTGGARKSTRLLARQKLDRFSNTSEDPLNIQDCNTEENISANEGPLNIKDCNTEGNINATEQGRGGGPERKTEKRAGGHTKQSISRKKSKKMDKDEGQQVENADKKQDETDSDEHERRTKAANDKLDKKETKKSSKAGKNEELKGKGKKIKLVEDEGGDEDKDKQAGYRTLTTRMSPHALTKSMENLSNRQEACLIEHGFRGLLKMKLDTIPTSLGYYVVRHFDATEMEIKTKNGHIKVTRETINEMLGVASSGVCLSSLESSDHGRDMKQKWLNQFEKQEIRPGHIVEKLSQTTEADLNFILNFMVLFANTMGKVKGNGWCDYDFLDKFHDTLDLRKINWCDFIFQCLSVCKVAWKSKVGSSHFCGPLTTLTLHYVDSVRCDGFEMPRTRPAIKGWTSLMMLNREKKEIFNGGFGLGAFYGQYREDDPESKEEMLQSLEGIYIGHMELKVESDRILRRAAAMFPNDVAFKEWTTKVRNLFAQSNEGSTSHASGDKTNEPVSTQAITGK